MREYPSNPVLGVGVIVLNDSRVLLVQRANEPDCGKWAVPGGVVELGETLAEAARREVREETGLEVEIGRSINLYNLIHRDAHGRVRFHYVIAHHLASYQGGTPRPGSDALNVGWFSEAEIRELPLPPDLADIVLKALREETVS